MSLQSWPKTHQIASWATRSEAGQGYVLRSTKGVICPTETTALRMGDEDDQVVKSEEINALFKARIGLMNTLTAKQGCMQEAMHSGGRLNEIKEKKRVYDECWREFVDVHEQYIQLLVCKEEKESACCSYKEQMTRKMRLDEMFASFRRRSKLEAKERGEEVSSSSRKTGSSSGSVSKSTSRRSSKLSTLSRRKEKLALAQLKRNQLLKQHELERRVAELNFEKEAMEATMEEERAWVSFNAYNQEVDEELEGRLDDDNITAVQQQQQVLSPLAQPFSAISHKTPHPPNTSLPQVTTAYPPEEQAAQSKLVPSQSAQPCITYGPPPHPPNTSLPQVTTAYPPEEQAAQSKLVPSQSASPYIPQEQPVQLPDTTSSQVSTPHLPKRQVEQAPPKETDAGEEMVRALRQMVTIPKIKYMQFNGDAIAYASFMHNFETFLEKDNPDDATRLQLLIQHCNGKARDAIESCVNLPAQEGYKAAKNTLYENFGKPYIIAKAHIKKLVDLPPLKQADGASLLEFTRHLESADRTLSSMGPQYESELNHMNTLRELNRKLPLFLRAKWTECAGAIMESGAQPKFKDFLRFVKKRAMLVNNEFGEDLCASATKPKDGEGKGNGRKKSYLRSSFAARVEKRRNDKDSGFSEGRDRMTRCIVCSANHRIWRCEKFKKFSYPEKKKVVQERELCFKCLGEGHYARACPKAHFKCQKEGCSKEHNTLLHPTSLEPAKRDQEDERSPYAKETNPPNERDGEASKQEEVKVTSITGAGERVCLSVISVKVRAKGSDRPAIETYALLDSGSEVTLCHERLRKQVAACGKKLDFTLQGMTGSTKVKSELVDIVVSSMDDEVLVELSKVRTVNEMPISENCIAKRGDVQKWPHLRDLPLQELETGEVMLVIGLQEKPALFLPLEYKKGGEKDPVAIRYSLGWTVMGPVGGQKSSVGTSSNFVRESARADNPSIGDFGCEFTSISPKFEEARESLVRENGKDCVVKGVPHQEHLLEERTEDPTFILPEGIGRERVNEELDRQLQRLWRTDFEGSLVETSASPSVEDTKALRIMEETLKIVDGHFQVALPWKNDPPYLPNNKVVAERRGFLLRKRLLRDDNLLEKYQATMNEYLDKGYAEKIPQEQLEVIDRPTWYLPHHPVTHPLKPNKVRVVYDCAASYGRTSLNQQLLQGPDQTNHLTGVLIRFREEEIAVVADVEAMFHQVLVEPRDRDALRFLWWPTADLSGDVTEYRMTRHLFGATSSPSVANFCLRRTAELYQNEFDPITVETVKRNMYVDDLMKSARDTAEATKLVSQLRQLLAKGGFRLTKWYSNNRDVMATIPETERAKSVKDLELDRLPTESALGIKWNTEEDNFVWDVAERMLQWENESSVTRRAIVSAVYSLFDPLGFIAPYVMKAKLLLQMLCRKGVGWDDPLQDSERLQWNRWLADLPKLQAVRVARCFKPEGFGDIKEIQLHLFSDASRLGYSAVAYLRLEDTSGQIHCAFVMGKARLAPLREISTPRLELTAAVISVRLSKIIQEELDLEIQRVFYWTDSTSVLKCINNESKRFHTFESNRLTVIRSGTDPSEWKYVNRDVNPADDGSKGVKLDVMLTKDRWLKGPGFLWKDETHWPRMIKVPALKDGDPEVRKEVQIYATTEQCNVLETLISHHSSWWKLKCAVAWLLRCKECLRARVRLKKSVSTRSAISSESGRFVGRLTVQELEVAEVEILRHVQRTKFPEELKGLQASRQHETPNKAFLRKTGISIRQLNPVLREGLIRVGGRLANASISNEAKCPIILPSNHHVTDMIIRDYHAEVGHMGQESVLSALRRRFWVIKGRTAVRRVIRRCISCQKRRARLGEQFMADLPQSRVTPHQPPFTHVGADYFGPLQVKQGRSLVKRYGCIFTCFTTRAVHIEIAHSLDTDSMINALRRLISIRGIPEEIRSDRGTNFVSANKELNKSMEEWDQNKIHKFCTQRRIKWCFNPPSASHMGGVWERMIRSVRQILKAVLKEQLISDEVLQTVMAEVTQILNSRPLTRNSDSPMDEDPLTPNHLLHLRPTSSLPPGVFDKSDSSGKRSWRQAQYLANLFWRRWTREYLPTLLERKKWCTPKRNFKIGDLVLVADENYARGQWPMAVVTEVITSKDGYVRTAKVKTTSTVSTRAKRRRRGDYDVNTTILTRPVAKLCLLEMDG